MDVFLELAQVKKIKKNHKVVEQGEAVSPLIFIQKGCLMTYHEDRSGFKHVIQFGLEGWWTGDIRSMQEETASFYGIKAIENTELYCFDLGTFN
jgi:CRP-like cAMP-binding protein